jgi:acetylornithine aminotransferase
VSAVALEGRVAGRLEASGFRYAQSHQNDPLGCAVAREVIAALREGEWIEKGRAMGAFFIEGLERLASKHTIVKEARGRGMLLGLELQPDGEVSVQTLYERLLSEGFLVGYYSAGNVLRFDPALTIEKEDVVSFLTCLDKVLGQVDRSEEV